MSGDNPKKPRPGWRQGGGDQPARQVHRGWKKEATEVTPTSSRRWIKIILGFVGIILLVGLLVVVLQWLYAAKPTALVLFGASYETNLAMPLNTEGWNGLQEMSQWATTSQRKSFFSSGSQVRLVKGIQELRADAPLESTWSTCFREVDDKNMIVVVTAHGSVDQHGRPYILTNDANLRTEKERIYIDEILNQLKEKPDQNKVLILDTMVMNSHWGLGMMNNRFAHAMKQMEGKIKEIKKLVVLVCADQDQASWCSADLRNTIFMHYVLEGLKGAADVPDDKNRAESGNGDGRVTALELAKYVHAKVQDWVRDNRGALQTPLLIGDPQLASDMTLVAVPEGYTPRAEPAETVALDKVAQAWAEWHDLQKTTQQPPPWTYAPRWWQLYTARLLRYEQLMRADHEAAAHVALKSAQSLLSKIKLMQPLKSTSAVGNALPIDAALAQPSGMYANPVFLELAEKIARERDKTEDVWKAALAQIGDEKRPVFVRFFMRYCLNRAIDQPQSMLEPSLQMLKLAEASAGYRPTEIHFMLMLKQHPRLLQNSQTQWSVIKLALETERLAAETALGFNPQDFPYVESLWNTFQPGLQEADQQRRFGYDHLFAERYNEATKYFVQAQQSYQRAKREAQPLRSALLLRDRLSVEMLWLSHWLPTLAEEDKPVIEQALEIWDGIHWLHRELEPQRVQARRDEKQQQVWIDQLIQQTQKINQQYESLEAFFRKRVDDLIQRSKGPPDQFVCQQIDDILKVPMIKPDRRQELLKAAREMSRKLYQQSAARLGGAKDLPKEVQTNNAQRRAEREARLALAALGEDWFSQKLKQADPEPYQTILNTIKTRLREKWPDVLTEIEPSIGRRWVLRADEVVAFTPAAQREESIQQAMALLAQAERQDRLVEVSTLLNEDLNPSETLRRLRWHDVFLGLAERTYQDFWASEKDAGEPYYYLAGLEFIRESRRLLEQQGNPTTQQNKWLETSRAMETLVNKRPVMQTINKPTTVHVTSERKFDLAYHLSAPAEMPFGFPFFWLTTASNSPLNQSTDSQRGQLLTVNDKQKTGSVLFALENRLLMGDQLPQPTDPVITTTLKLESWYRGHRMQVPTPAVVYPYPDIRMIEPFIPNVSSLVLRASDDIHRRFASDNSGIVFLLDCSGSMSEKDEKTGQSRFNIARTALIEVLNKLPKDKGTKVSVWCFSAKVSGTNSQPNAEETIRRLVGPVIWTQDELDRTRSLLNELEPWNTTPLVRAIVRASADLLPLQGFKTMIVLTDGMDTCFERGVFGNVQSNGDPQLNPDGKRKVAEFLNQFFNQPEYQEIVVNIIGFQLPADEKEQANSQFLDVLSKLPSPGRFVLAEEKDKLIQFLEKFRQQKLLYFLEEEVGARLVTPDGIDVTLIPKRSQRPPNYAWKPLAPMNYLVYALERRLAQRPVQLRDGQLLLLDLVPDRSGDRPIIRRGIFADDYPDKPRAEGEQWLLAALQNQRINTKTQEIMPTLESLDRTGRANTLQQPTPFFTWYELRPTDNTLANPRLEWGGLPLIPAPAWTMKAYWANPPENLPKTQLQVWWNSTEEPHFAARLERETSSTWEQTINRKLSIEGQECLVESVRFEDQFVPSQKDQSLEKKSCLVIRIAFPPNSPIMVKPDLEVISAVHQYYLQAGKYTGIFPVDELQANRRLGSMRVYSLTKFKKMDTTRTITLPLDSPNQEERPFRSPGSLLRP